MNIIIAIFPIVLLIYLMTKKKSIPSYKALPLVAVLLYLIKLFYFKSDFTLMNATVINGLLTAWTPILVIWGAIFLFNTLEHTGGLKTIRKWLNSITTNPVGQLMIIGWAFMFLVEGASGFGTPAALAAPLLVGLRFKPIKVAIFCLIMNSIPVTFGGVGIPTWFGFSQLGLSANELITIGFKSAIIHTVAALVIPIIALRFILPTKTIKHNLIFIYLSILSCVIPYLALSYYNYEFPSILGGTIGLILTIFFAHNGIGLKEKHAFFHPPFSKIIKASFPLWGTIILLLITRIKQLGVNSLLTATRPSLDIAMQPFADLSISPSLVIQLKNILGTESSWSHKLLYVPSLIPFFLIAFLTFLIFRTKKKIIKKTWNQSWQQIKKPILALSGALVFVKLLMVGGDQALTMIIGKSMANIAGHQWQFFASYLGALGSFFAGSNTISNLTFGGIQYSIAQSLNLNLTTILSMQSVGGAMGNMICISNIVAVCSVLKLKNKGGYIIKRTIIPMVIYGVIAGVVGMVLN